MGFSLDVSAEKCLTNCRPTTNSTNASVTNTNGGGGGGDNPDSGERGEDNPPPTPPSNPTLTISAPDEACPGDMIPISIGGENLETDTITVTGGGISHSLGPNQSFMGTLHNQLGEVILTATAGTTSVSTTIQIVNCDENGNNNSDGGVGGGDNSNNQSPTLTIRATNIACAGDTIEVTIDGENLERRIITVTGGANPTSGVDSVSRKGPGSVEVKMPDNPEEITLSASTPGAESGPAGVTVFDIASISEESGKIIPVYAGTTLTEDHFSLSTTTEPMKYESHLTTSYTFDPETASGLLGMSEQTITIKRKGCSEGKEAEITATIVVVNSNISTTTQLNLNWGTSLSTVASSLSKRIEKVFSNNTVRNILQATDFRASRSSKKKIVEKNNCPMIGQDITDKLKKSIQLWDLSGERTFPITPNPLVNLIINGRASFAIKASISPDLTRKICMVGDVEESSTITGEGNVEIKASGTFQIEAGRGYIGCGGGGISGKANVKIQYNEGFTLPEEIGYKIEAMVFYSILNEGFCGDYKYCLYEGTL